MREGRELRGGSIGILGRQIPGRALTKDSHRIREAALEYSEIAEPGRGVRRGYRAQ